MLGSTLLASILLAATGVNAHATFQQLWVNGADKAGTCVRTVASNSPVTSVSGSDITCNVGGTKAAASTCAVSAGDTVTVEMHQQPNDRSCSSEAIGGNHDGPVIVYLAKVDDVTTSNPSSAGWFKIAQTGLVSKDYWGTDVLNKNCGKYDVKIPSDIAPGNYLLRAEVIALHVAGSVGGAQFYISCYQLQVSGSGSASPATVKFPGAYSATDPGIKFDIYGSYTSYTIPGPAVYSGGGGNGGNPGTTQAPTTTFTTSWATTSTTAPSTTAVGGTVAQYGQCGGTDYKGPTTCASPYTCKAVSPPYYYQCQ